MERLIERLMAQGSGLVERLRAHGSGLMEDNEGGHNP
jgi:hypothetical protein